MKRSELALIGGTLWLILAYTAYCHSDYFTTWLNYGVMFLSLVVAIICFIAEYVLKKEEVKKKDEEEEED